jgi:ribonuclease HI
MKNSNYRASKSINKQYMLPQYKTPPNERKKEIDSIYYDPHIIRVYVDASELKNQGIFGLGAAFVGNGEVVVKSKKEYHSKLKGQIWYGETRAICHALEILTKLISNPISASAVQVYSDLELVQSLDEENNNRTKLIIKEQISLSLEKLDKYQCNFHSIELLFLNNKEKKFNPYYTAAHNAARQILGIE